MTYEAETFMTDVPRTEEERIKFSSLSKIDVKVTCTGFYVYVEIIYIDSSPDPEILPLYVYSEPSDETIRHPQQRKLHQRSLKSRSTRVFNFMSIG